MAIKHATFREKMMASTKEERSQRVANMRANFPTKAVFRILHKMLC